MSDPINKQHFDIHASIIFQLGEDLISDEIQALVELVKNSYDADATYVQITANTKDNPKNSMFPNAEGYMTIEDDGCGMDESTIVNGWLTISNSLKRILKRQDKTTRKGRIPLGEKGLGRLGSQRLGYNLELITRPENSNIEYYMAFSWRSFQGEQLLSNVEFILEKQEPTIKKSGTKLIISDLRNLDFWRKDTFSELQVKLSRMVSPYKEIKDFMVIVSIDGKELETVGIAEKVRRIAQLRYYIDFDGELFKIIGKAKLNYCRPSTPEDKEFFQQVVENDNGEEFFNFLVGQGKAKTFNFSKPKDKNWFIEYELTKHFEDFDLLVLEDGKQANPGPFRGEIDSFDLGADGKQANLERINSETNSPDLETDSIVSGDVFSTMSEYRQYLKNFHGIRIYRDGFGISVERDWLKLGGQWTSAPSYYTLKPNNTLGYIALSVKNNKQLEEKTDREGFKITPHYENFYELLTQFKKFSQDAQECIRRSSTDFLKRKKEKLANVPSKVTTEFLSKKIKDSLSKAKVYKTKLENLRLTTEAQITNENGNTKEVVEDIEKYFQELAELEAINEILTNKIETLKEQITQVYETVSLGLTAEALSHEIHNVSDIISNRTTDIGRYIKQKNINDVKIFAYIEHVKSSYSSLRKQLSFLTPFFKYVRENKTDIPVLDFFYEVTQDYYIPRYEKNNINFQIKDINSHDFIISMNKGKFAQIIENIFLNSNYWLREELRLNRINQGIILVEISKPFIRISDNGRGIDQSVESSLFELFVTTKGRGKGRGLGLFIVQQLLDSEECTISLLPTRNQHNRQYKFEINLTGALKENG